MKTSLSRIITCISSLTISLFFAPFTWAAPPSYPISTVNEILDQPDSSTIDLYSALFIPTRGQNTSLLYDLVQELHALPVGKQYNYYSQILEQRGFLVLNNYNDDQHWDFALEKMQQHVRLTVTYNNTTGKSTSITASGPRIAPIRTNHETELSSLTGTRPLSWHPYLTQVP